MNDYLRDISGDVTAKDFRTWAGTGRRLDGPQRFTGSDDRRKKAVVEAIERPGESLGNTPTVCRQCYVHPAVPEATWTA